MIYRDIPIPASADCVICPDYLPVQKKKKTGKPDCGENTLEKNQGSVTGLQGWNTIWRQNGKM